MKKVNIQELKANFPRFLSELEAESVLTICRRNMPIAELRMIKPTINKKRKFGQHRSWGKFDYGVFEQQREISDAFEDDEIVNLKSS